MGSWRVADTGFLCFNLILWYIVFKSQQEDVSKNLRSCEAVDKFKDSVLKSGIGFAYDNVHGREKCDET
jgi:hypothetical protein